LPDTDQKPFCLFGLGNPGERYESTRHNIGFLVADLLAARLNVKQWRFEFNRFILEARWKQRVILLCKPWTYMNLSGDAVLPVLRRHSVEPDGFMVVCDDAVLPAGNLRLRAKGGSGGQNGLESIIDTIGTETFTRLRCGVGPCPDGVDLSEYVLGVFDEAEQDIVKDMVTRATDAVFHYLDHGLDRTMTVYNSSSTINNGDIHE